MKLVSSGPAAVALLLAALGISQLVGTCSDGTSAALGPQPSPLRGTRPEVRGPAALSGQGGREGIPELPLNPNPAANRLVPEAEVWSPPEGSPVRLMAPDIWKVWEPTEKSAHDWYLTVKEFDGMTQEQWDRAWSLPKFREAWVDIREQVGLRHFIIQYRERERDRWTLREPSLSLEGELQPCRRFIDEHFGDTDEFWGLVNSYSTEVADQIWAHGESVGQQDAPDSMWPLHRTLVGNATAPFELVAELLRGVTQE